MKGLLPLRVSAVCIVALLAGCASVPEKPIVTGVTTLPPVHEPVPTRCLKKVPVMPTPTICVPVEKDDPNCSVLRRYYEMKAAITELDAYRIEANAAILGCAAVEPPQ